MIFFQTYLQVYVMILSICRCYPKQPVSIYDYVQVLYTSKQPNICVLLLTEVPFCVVLLKTFCHIEAVKGCAPSMMFMMSYIVVFISRMCLIFSNWLSLKLYIAFYPLKHTEFSTESLVSPSWAERVCIFQW